MVTSSQVRRSGPVDVLNAYVALMKPRIIELLLLTTVPVMFLAARDVPSFWLIVATVVGGTLSAGSANALNCVFDADIDQKMRRTSRRPLPRHGVSTAGALWFGLALAVDSTLWLGRYTTPRALRAVCKVRNRRSEFTWPSSGQKLPPTTSGPMSGSIALT